MNNYTVIGKRIAEARKKKKLTQEQLGGKLGVSFQAVSSWEQGKYIPDSDHLTELAGILDLSLDRLFAEEETAWQLKPINDDFGHMYTFVKGRAQIWEMPQTLKVLDLLRVAHGAQERRSKNGFATSYMVHPLTMACHALAMGLKEDNVIAGCLSHDMVEDSAIPLKELPVNETVREAVRCMTRRAWGESVSKSMDLYYAEIRVNPLACLVKCIDRCNNLAGMADAFSRRHMIHYAEETDQYYPALLDVVKKVPEWNNAWWLLRYQIRSLLETYKRML
ncbi:MAG: helix-turn-helix domain-containing protein [Clostridia bacterium]|nr:helix-turn-helix domain-containing protein [Clostridia bacterium]